MKTHDIHRRLRRRLYHPRQTLAASPFSHTRRLSEATKGHGDLAIARASDGPESRTGSFVPQRIDLIGKNGDLTIAVAYMNGGDSTVTAYDYHVWDGFDAV